MREKLEKNYRKIWKKITGNKKIKITGQLTSELAVAAV